MPVHSKQLFFFSKEDTVPRGLYVEPAHSKITGTAGRLSFVALSVELGPVRML